MKYYIQLWSMVFIGFLICFIMWLSCEPRIAEAHHDRIYTPCDTETGHIHMSYEEVVARISIMEQEGIIPAGMISRYVEARDGGKGNEDPRRVWARDLEEGQILSLGNWANGEHPELEQLMFNSGMVAQWQLDANKKVRRFNDPYWRQPNPLSPAFTVWQTLCMANLNYSIPMFEVNDEGEWISNAPTVTTTTTIIENHTVSSSQDEISGNGLYAQNEKTALESLSQASNTVNSAVSPVKNTISIIEGNWIERWFEAEWNDFPFEETIKLLEERYPPNTPNKYHFRLSTAVEFLREGGKLKGLDNVWNN